MSVAGILGPEEGASGELDTKSKADSLSKTFSSGVVISTEARGDARVSLSITGGGLIGTKLGVFLAFLLGTPEDGVAFLRGQERDL
ncbi:hypothetical protein G6F43_014441 [Rhizopus delemar]|nr:hypothetical protein G6F43_014441 [Rhizopus delemar]